MLRGVVGAAVVAIMLAACGGSSDNGSGGATHSIDVSAATWHVGEWPFTVSSGTLSCTQPPFPGAVTFSTGGGEYAVNGTALDSGFADIKPIWKRAGGGLRVDIGDMIDRGLALCPNN
jgi:hypothetical protein